MLHCRFFIDFYLRATYLLDCLRRIFYLLWEAFPRRHLGQVLDPAQAKFVVCDYTIENGLHYRRDATLREDYAQVRMGHAPQMLAVLNNTVLGLFAKQGQTNIAHARRAFAYHFDKALASLVA